MTTQRPALILDADGVILDWRKGFVGFVEWRRGVVPSTCHTMDPHFDLRQVFPTLTRDERVGLIKEYALSPRFAAMEMLPGVLEMVSELRRLDPDLPIHCVTACGNHPDTVASRVANLSPLGLDHVEALPVGASKEGVLARYPAGSVLVDDQFEHVLAADDLGHHGILMHQHYNANVDAPRRMSDWAEIQDFCVQMLSRPTMGGSAMGLPGY